MNLTSKFDMREVDSAFRAYLQHSKRSPAVILEKQMTQLAVGAKGVKGLFQEALSTRPDTVAKIKALPGRLGYRVKREGGSVKAEIARRIVNAGYYQASGWIVPGIGKPRGRGSVIKTQRGEISRNGGANASITIKNTSPQAFEFGERTGYIQRALNNRAKDMRKYVEKQMASDAKEFSKRKPHFVSIESLMRV